MATKYTSQCKVIFCVGTGDLELQYAVDDHIVIYGDGLTVATSRSDTTHIPSNTRVLAFQASNAGGPKAVVIWLSNGVVSDTSWRCTDDQPAGAAWMYAGFDDSGWLNATSVIYPADDNMLGMINAGATQIWGDCGECDTIYCRRDI